MNMVSTEDISDKDVIKCIQTSNKTRKVQNFKHSIHRGIGAVWNKENRKITCKKIFKQVK